MKLTDGTTRSKLINNFTNRYVIFKDNLDDNF